MSEDNMFSDLKEFVQYQSIPISKSFVCPNCRKSGDGFYHVPGKGYIELPKSKLIGWCNTNSGYMMVFECTECFEKYRYHNCTTERYNFDKFKEELWLVWILQKK
jgi:hypothetical protein